MCIRDRPSTRRAPWLFGPLSSGRSRLSRCHWSCPGSSTTMASSTLATPAPSSGCASRPSTPPPSKERTPSVSSGCEPPMSSTAPAQPTDANASGKRVITSVLVANRGEIARRVFTTCRARGLATVAVFSDADADSPHVREADRAVRLPGVAPLDTYLRGDVIIAAARAAGADAIHPGYGFLSESAEFARQVLDAGMVWIGPPVSAIESMGSKVASKQVMADAGVPVLARLDPQASTGKSASVMACGSR